ncbi:MAG: heme-binding protein [Planctomycetes bacterium]|nr:heme-binding protein [Planctomycetota bacterium]
MRTFLLGTLLLTAPLFAQARPLEPADLAGRRAAAEAITALLAQKADLPTSIAMAAIAGTQLGEGSAARSNLDAALSRANLAPRADAALRTLRVDLGELAETLTFQPTQQAELPKGFPGFQAVDEIELRQYPAYRMVRTDMQGGSNRAFWPLFRHIESNGIAMTTPVQMDWGRKDSAGAEKPMQMAFLYGDMTIAPQHVADGVEVVAIEAQTVLSIGAIGDDRPARVEAMRARLEAFVEAHRGIWMAAGPLRTMGYNSPMVSRDRRYFEVQLPVQKVESKGRSAIR